MEHKHEDHCHTHSHGETGDACHSHGGRVDYIYYGSLFVIVIAYFLHLGGFFAEMPKFAHFNHLIFEVMNDMWWGIAISIVAVGFLSNVPREMVMAYFSHGNRYVGLFKATLAGTLFDLCNHGVLVLGMKIYERGASLGQTMAFLISSPWNSFSLTIIMYSLIGGELTFTFLLLSLLIAFVTGWICEELVHRKILPANPNRVQPAQMTGARIHFEWSRKYFTDMLVTGFKESRKILKWIFFGAILSALVGTFMTPEMFMEYFGNSIRGTLSTLGAATAIEICSEGSVPLAADLVNVAGAPGNAFIFLMAGVATDLTEILVIRETTKSWKIALLLPIITVPQILILGILMNLGYF